MRLPRLPNGFMKSRAQTIRFLGVNLTENYVDGEMFDCKNLSTLQYPTLSQRKGRAVLEEYSDMVTDLYEWGGHIVVVDNGMLYVDGESIVSVNSERKQFAVVNSRLIVFPDKISVDLRNNEYKEMAASVRTPGTANSATITHNSITAPLEGKIVADKGYGYRSNSEQHNTSPFFYTYGTNLTAVRECWDESTSTWDLTALEALQEIVAPGTDASNLLTDISNEMGHIFIPRIQSGSLASYYAVNGNVKNNTVEYYPDTSQYNDLGYVAIITDLGDNWYGAGNTYYYHMTYDIYDINSGNVEFRDVFDVGDMVDITGTLHGLLDTTYNGDDTTTSAKIKITGITETTASQTNALQFADNTFNIPYAAKKITSEKLAGDYYISVKQAADSSSYYYFKFTMDKKILKNQVLVIYGVDSTQTIYVWDIEKHKMVTSYSGTRATSAPASGYTNLGTLTLYDTSSQVITINRAIPDLDYICERDNRLWGVSNNDKTIYCSALGIPWDFYDYNGLDTGAYAVAVGSAGDFTGIVSYGGVLCFKEDKVHKMLGSFPSDFYMTTYDVAGIAQGAERSAVIISEVLYYRAPLGVMAFTGYQPTNISPNLALENTTGGVAGTNGREYFICVQAKEGTDHYSLFKYDLQYKYWLKEDDINVKSMTSVGNDLYMAVSTTRTVDVEGQTYTVESCTPYLTGQQNEEGMNLDWFAQFLPFSDSMAANGIRKVGYSRIILRFDMAPGALFTVKVREDDGQWKQAWSQVATHKLAHTVPLRIGRCDKFEIRLEGKGQTKIRAMEREFVQGGWYDGSNFY